MRCFPDIVEASSILVALITLELFLCFVLNSAMGLFPISNMASATVVVTVASGITISSLLQYMKLGYRDILHFSPVPARRVVGLALGPLGITCLGLVFVMLEIDEVMQSLFPMSEFFRSTFAMMRADTLPALLLLLAIAPAMEELLFRGVFLRSFLVQYQPRTAIVASSLLFAIFHLNIYQIPVALAFGLLSGWLLMRTSSLWPSILAHSLVNLFTLLVPAVKAFVGAWRFSSRAIDTSTIGFTLLGCLLLCAGLLTLSRLLNHPQPCQK